MARFQDKRVLITGGTSGMGLAGARRIVREGGSVIVTGMTPARLDAARSALGEKGEVLANDAADPAAASVLAQAADTAGDWMDCG